MINFTKYYHSLLIVSAILVVLSCIFVIILGLNFGVDFTGGTLLERSVNETVSVEDIRNILHSTTVDLPHSIVQLLDEPNEFMVRTRALTNTEIQQLDQAFSSVFGTVIERRTDVVGPIIGRELLRNALLALFVASIGIVAYLSLRFEYRFAVAALIAVLHDVVIIMGVFAIANLEVTGSFVAAILTVIGYSINDTVVIFDRIRENLGELKGNKSNLTSIVNKSLNQTLARTINTSLTTFIVVFLLLVLGGSAIRDFALALVIGVIVGTYSSVFIAGGIWLKWASKGSGVSGK